jgi:hypothetical protein
MVGFKPKRLGELALEWGLITRKELLHTLQFQEGLRRSSAPLKIGQVFVKLDYLSTSELVQLLEVQRKIAGLPQEPERNF